MSRPQQVDPLWRPAPYWQGRLAALVANADLLERLGLSMSRLLQGFVDPRPHYGQPPSDPRRNISGRALAMSEETPGERSAREKAEARYLETRNRVAARFGLPAKTMGAA